MASQKVDFDRSSTSFFDYISLEPTRFFESLIGQDGSPLFFGQWTTEISDFKRMVGGYGIGYEPDAESMGQEFHNTSAFGADIQHQNEMDCDSLKSSSSLINDWLEASQMEQRDIEQLQRELELGSPMCIDDYSFKPD